MSAGADGLILFFCVLREVYRVTDIVLCGDVIVIRYLQRDAGSITVRYILEYHDAFGSFLLLCSTDCPCEDFRAEIVTADPADQTAEKMLFPL